MNCPICNREFSCTEDCMTPMSCCFCSSTICLGCVYSGQLLHCPCCYRLLLSYSKNLGMVEMLKCLAQQQERQQEQERQQQQLQQQQEQLQQQLQQQQLHEQLQLQERQQLNEPPKFRFEYLTSPINAPVSPNSLPEFSFQFPSGVQPKQSNQSNFFVRRTDEPTIVPQSQKGVCDFTLNKIKSFLESKSKSNQDASEPNQASASTMPVHLAKHVSTDDKKILKQIYTEYPHLSNKVIYALFKSKTGKGYSNKVVYRHLRKLRANEQIQID